MWFCLFGFSFRDYDGQTAVHNAAGDGHEAVVRRLLEKEVDFEARNKDGKTALHNAAEKWRPGGKGGYLTSEAVILCFSRQGSGEALQWQAGDVRSG